ncbi:hypothetical protein [Paraburkholderia aspalathi]|uniref:Uncharacterized protein n=1 Tax=Paraburkholderia aspalathi TaxID=1324617 RepID=A0A1I7EGY2_9BURK|nr:hypothetical protein [Paraburkholderia aspalathi]SFU23166.1 hypothetical protein SAMN05192563_102044 [Paraburkholderia aspalathi]
MHDPKKMFRIPREGHVEGCGCKGCRRKRNARMPDPSLATQRETQRLIDEAEVAKYIAPVEQWESQESPPLECIQFGRMVRYRRTDVARLIKALRVSGD